MQKTLFPRFGAVLAALVLSMITAFAQSGPPPLPPSPYLDSYSFLNTNWDSDFGYAPIGYTNLVSVLDWGGNALLLDTTNETSAFLNYKIVETNGFTHIDLGAGAVMMLIVPNWASADTNQYGQGPGERGYLLRAGDRSSNAPQGSWAIYVDAGGTNIYFGGVSNSAATTYVRAPISWASNSLHVIGLTYSTNTELYLDGQLAATGSPVTIIPATNTWTNGFYVGSDDSGFEQFRGIFLYLELDNTNLVAEYGTSYFTESWDTSTNAYYAWLNGDGGADFMSSAAALSPHGFVTHPITGTNVYLTNVSSQVVPGYGLTFTFTIEGGSNGWKYDVFAATNLIGPTLTNTLWTWLGQGTNGGIYQITNQTSVHSYYVLGGPRLAPDGSGATVAYEALVPSWHDAQIVTEDDDIVVYGAPLATSGSSESCPGAYTGYINYTLAAPLWGWPPSTNTTVYTASDTNRTNTKIEYMGAYGDEGCGQTTVTIPYPPYSPFYRFTIYFTNDVPETNYTITLSGFNP